MMLKPTTQPISNIDTTIDVGIATVHLNAQPTNTYLLIRIVNHWITNLLQYYDNEKNEDDIHHNQAWYIKWSSKYSYIRSSKRSLYDVYKALSEDGSIDESVVTTYLLIDWLKENIPKFVTHYDLTENEGKPNDMNHFKFSIKLYYSPYEDTNNRFADYASGDDNFVPFNANKSIATKNTNIRTIGLSEEDHTLLPVYICS